MYNDVSFQYNFKFFNITLINQHFLRFFIHLFNYLPYIQYINKVMLTYNIFLIIKYFLMIHYLNKLIINYKIIIYLNLLFLWFHHHLNQYLII